MGAKFDARRILLLLFAVRSDYKDGVPQPKVVRPARKHLMVTICMARALAWLQALILLAAFSSCEKPTTTTASAPPEVLVTDVVQKEVPIFAQ